MATGLLVLIMGAEACPQQIDLLRTQADSISDLSQKARLHWDLTLHFDSLEQNENVFFHAERAAANGVRSGQESISARAYLLMARYSLNAGRERDAITYFRLYTLLADELDRQAYRSQIRQLKEDFQREKAILENYLTSTEEILMRERSISQENQLLARYRLIYLIASLVVLALFAGVSLYFNDRARKRYKKDLKSQQEYTAEVEKSSDEIREEVTRLNRRVNAMEKDRLGQLKLAQQIQKDLLPGEKALEKAFSRSFIVSRPRMPASGDLFWFGESKGRRIVMVMDIGDSGVKGSFLLLVINEIMKRLVSEEVTAPNMILTLLDQQIRQKLVASDEEEFYGFKTSVVSFTKNELEVSSSLLPVYLVNKGEVRVLEAGRQPVGSSFYEEKFFEVQSFKFRAGDTLYLTTDGFEDQFGGKANSKFSRPSLRKLLASISLQDINEQAFMVEKVFTDWRGSAPQTDDILIVGIRK